MKVMYQFIRYKKRIIFVLLFAFSIFIARFAMMRASDDPLPDLQYDLTIPGDITISTPTNHSGMNVCYTGNVTLASSLNVANGNVVIMGALNTDNGGVLSVSQNANVYVKNDLREQSDNGGGVYGETTGSVRMLYNTSRIVVLGNFYTQTTSVNTLGVVGSTLELHGNFTQIGTDTVFYPGYALLSFSGGEQHVSFDRCGAQACLYGISGANPARRVYFDTPIYRFSLTEDAYIYGNLSIGFMPAKGYSLTVDGNLITNQPDSYIYSNLVVNRDLMAGGGLTLTGNIIIKRNFWVNGSYNVSLGTTTGPNITAVFEGDMHIQKYDGGSGGETGGSVTVSHCDLTVMGDFYTQSTDNRNFLSYYSSATFYGNITQLGTNTYFTQILSQDKMIFAGGKDQHISLTGTNNNLSYVYYAKSGGHIIFDSPVYRMDLAGDAIFYGNADIRNLYCYGYTVYFMGSAALSNVSGSTNGGNVYIDGDLLSSGPIIDGNYTVIVNGDAHINLLNLMNSTLSIRGNLYNEGHGAFGTNRYVNIYFTSGMLDLKGDYIQTYADSGIDASYNPSRIQLSGDSQSFILPGAANISIMNLYIKNQPSGYTVDNGTVIYTFSEAGTAGNGRKYWINLYQGCVDVTVPELSLPPAASDEGPFIAFTGHTNPYEIPECLNDPVDLVSGNLTWKYTDLEVYGSRNLSFSRTYNSANKRDGVSGAGWSNSFGCALSETPAGASVTADDGYTYNFIRNSGGVYTAPEGTDAALNETADGFVFTLYDKTEYIFDGGDKLISIKYANGDKTLFEYTDGMMTKASNNAGFMAFTYTDGHLASITDNIGRTVSYEYDSNNNLVKFTNADNDKICYTYDDRHNLLEVSDFNGNTYLKNKYGDSGRVTEQYLADQGTGYFTYDTAGKNTVFTDAKGNIHTYYYDDNNKITKAADADGEAGQVFENGRLISKTD